LGLRIFVKDDSLARLQIIIMQIVEIAYSNNRHDDLEVKIGLYIQWDETGNKRSL
jgi:hypothetical protein